MSKICGTWVSFLIANVVYLNEIKRIRNENKDNKRHTLKVLCFELILYQDILLKGTPGNVNNCCNILRRQVIYYKIFR